MVALHMSLKNSLHREVRPWLAAGLLIGGSLWMLPYGRLHEYGTVPWFLVGAGIMLGGYFLALGSAQLDRRMVAVVAVLTRLILLFQVPGEDIYRYVWEGRILGQGWNPYIHSPDAALLGPLRDDVWASVQHKTFTAIYPPLAEWVFAGMAFLCAAPIFFKAVFLFADLAVAWILARRFGVGPAVLYAWNPLVIYSFAGGGHYDSLFVLAMVLGWLAWQDGRGIWAAGWLGVAVAIKWLALPLLAWVGWRILLGAWRSGHWRIVCLSALAGVLPLVVSYGALNLWTGEWTTQLHPPKFSQYARSAEFIPGMVGWFWEQSKYHNQWFAIPLAAGWMWVVFRGRDFARSAEALFFLSLVLTPMMHAWYFTWMIPFAVATRNRGAIAVTASAFVYFILYHHVEAPQGRWLLSSLETALLWLPFALGFVQSVWKGRAESQRKIE